MSLCPTLTLFLCLDLETYTEQMPSAGAEVLSLAISSCLCLSVCLSATLSFSLSALNPNTQMPRAGAQELARPHTKRRLLTRKEKIDSMSPGASPGAHHMKRSNIPP